MSTLVRCHWHEFTIQPLEARPVLFRCPEACVWQWLILAPADPFIVTLKVNDKKLDPFERELAGAMFSPTVIWPTIQLAKCAADDLCAAIVYYRVPNKLAAQPLQVCAGFIMVPNRERSA
jgi:hypothetical protein